MKTYDVCIIGGGAAGLSAAASLDTDMTVCLLEKNKIPGRKIMATGGGRCNITNRACGNKDMALEFFKSMGIETYCDAEGRYYPYSNQASDVVKALLMETEKRNARIVTEFEAVKTEYRDGSFIVSDTKGRQVYADRLLVAAGGKAAPQFGTTGDGYGFAKAFGHTIKKVYPILTGVQCSGVKGLKGVRARGRVSLSKDRNLLAEETGEIQFTADGLSGICVMNLTPHIVSEEGESLEQALKRYELELDLAPDFTREEIFGRTSTFGILSDKLSARVSIEELKNWRLPIKGVKGWKDAQCTGGGISLDEIDMNTMESKLKKDLYFAGEIIDRQGICGGFNLQNAWETGLTAAAAINRRMKESKKEAK